MTVRTRIAPSPTGDPHVGTAYIALFNYCFAKQHGGEFILRIEDTDQARSTAESEQKILQSLRWLGLDWSEGPDVGGEHGPYRQSERKDIYRQYAEQMIADGNAFYCFRTPQELDVIREERKAQGLVPGIKGDLELPADEVEQRLAAGESHVIRMKVPDEGECVIHDRLRGDIVVPWAQVDSQILLKSDGMPTYHLASVVDDHLMQITHVIRGEEWINSAPKHLLLYQYLQWDMPEIIHLPLLRNPDKSKLSKRKNPTSIHYYRDMGFLPEALLNFLGRMGWSMPDEREKFSLAEMLEHFDIDRVSLGGPIFDVEKLTWLNGLWIREELDDDALLQRIQQWALNSERFAELLPHARQRMSTFSDFIPLTSFVFEGDLKVDIEAYSAEQEVRDEQKKHLQFALWKLDTLQQWDRDSISAVLMAAAQYFEQKPKNFLKPFFIAITGTSSSFSVMDAMALLGPDMSRTRLRQAVDSLGGVGKKALKKWEKEYQSISW